MQNMITHILILLTKSPQQTLHIYPKNILGKRRRPSLIIFNIPLFKNQIWVPLSFFCILFSCVPLRPRAYVRRRRHLPSRCPSSARPSQRPAPPSRSWSPPSTCSGSVPRMHTVPCRSTQQLGISRLPAIK